MLVYGTALFNGDAVPQDLDTGYAYVSRAAAQGLGPAKETLAQMDQVLPLEDRKKGLVLAPAKVKAQAAGKTESKPPPTKPGGRQAGQARFQSRRSPCRRRP